MSFGGLSRPAITQQKKQDTPYMNPKTKKTEPEQNKESDKPTSNPIILNDPDWFWAYLNLKYPKKQEEFLRKKFKNNFPQK